jgi:hypothetical protein
MTLTPLQEVNLSKQQAEVQIKDATKRNVVWAAEDDPDYIRLENGMPVPIGIRGQEGLIKALPIQASVGEAQYGGVSERVPTKLQEMVSHGIWEELFYTDIFPFRLPDVSLSGEKLRKRSLCLRPQKTKVIVVVF